MTSKSEKVTCPKCGRPGYLKVQVKASGRYRYIRHIEEHYLGKVKEE